MSAEDPLGSALDKAWAETVAHLTDVEDAAEALDEDAHDDECDHEHQCYEPHEMALDKAVEQVAHVFGAASCSVDREEGVDCDHQVAGEECPVATMDEDTIEALAHQANCPNCTASMVIAVAWPYAVTAEAALTVQHLLLLKTRAEQEGQSEAAKALAEAIDNIANARHRMH